MARRALRLLSRAARLRISLRAELDLCPFWRILKLENPVKMGTPIVFETPPDHGRFQKPVLQNRAPKFRRCKTGHFSSFGSLSKMGTSRAKDGGYWQGSERTRSGACFGEHAPDFCFHP